jgi:hypothetical protein
VQGRGIQREKVCSHLMRCELVPDLVVKSEFEVENFIRGEWCLLWIGDFDRFVFCVLEFFCVCSLSPVEYSIQLLYTGRFHGDGADGMCAVSFTWLVSSSGVWPPSYPTSTIRVRNSSRKLTIGRFVSAREFRGMYNCFATRAVLTRL